MQYFRTAHRIAATLIVIVTLYLSVTGLMIQGVDLRTLFHHAPASDPNIMAIRESFDGPADYQVIGVPDYTAPALQASADLNFMLQTVMRSARATLGDRPVRYVELRMLDGKPAGQVESEGEYVLFDGLTGQLLSRGSSRSGEQRTPSIRNNIKWYHRMTIFGNWVLFINVMVGIGLVVMILTGIALYWKMWRTRKQIGSSGLFWVGGDWKRAMHRGVGFVAAAFLLVVALSGTWLAYESLYLGFYMHRMAQLHTSPNKDVSSPLKDSELPRMLQVTLDSEQSKKRASPIKVVRLRYYAGMPQGVVVAGTGDDTRQLVFNAATGRVVSETEPGYPPTGFPFGWQDHQIAKSVHRGDIIGMPGRFMDLFSGLALLYLSINGIALYVDLWTERNREGHKKLFWVDMQEHPHLETEI